MLDSNIDEAQLQRLRNGERPGALWHLFRSDDAKKVREYIGRVCPNQKHTRTVEFPSSACSRHNEKVRDPIPFMIKQLI